MTYISPSKIYGTVRPSRLKRFVGSFPEAIRMHNISTHRLCRGKLITQVLPERISKNIWRMHYFPTDQQVEKFLSYASH